MLLLGVVAPYACGGTAIIDPPDDGSGGSGASTTTNSATTTSSSTGGAPSTSVGPTSSSSGMPGCIGCGDYVVGDGDLEAICGVLSVDPSGMVAQCTPNTSCEIYNDLVACTCGPICQADCPETCNGGELTTECIGCITTECTDEFNACSGDVQ